MTAVNDPPFDFDHLVDVQPLLATADVDEMSLTIDSIERYSHGFALVLWATTLKEPAQLLAISASDISGHRYDGQMLASHGSGAKKTGWTNRIVCSFTPALDTNARSMTLAVTSVRKLGFKAGQGFIAEPADVIGGPWEFRFDLFPMRDDLAGHQHRPATVDPVSSTPSTAQRQPVGSSMNRVVSFRSDGGIRPPHLSPRTLTRVIPVARRQEAASSASRSYRSKPMPTASHWWHVPITWRRS